MGKAAKTIAPYAAIGFGIWATGGIGAGGWLYNTTSTLGSNLFGPSVPGLLNTGGGLAGLFKGSSPATLALAGAGFVANLGAANARRNEAILRQQEESRRMRLVRLQALQAEAAALKTQGAARGAAIAKAVAQGQDIGSRSFLAFLDDQERETQQQIGSIRVSAEAGLQTSQLRIRQFGQQGTAAIFEGMAGAARSLLTARA